MHQCANAESERAMFQEQRDADITVQLTEEEEVLEEDQDEFQQIPSDAEVASQLTSAVRWLETQAFDPV